jgi:ABC-type transport system involved in cytochrome c biogenesis permease subunit
MNAATIPGFDGLYYAGALLYLLCGVAELVRWDLRRTLLGTGVVVHAAGFLLRAHAISYFPLTNKFESFYGFAGACFACAWLVSSSPSRVHRAFVWGIGAVFYLGTFFFDRGRFYPPPLMLTVWYPLHVPASFSAYALWTSAAGAGLAVLLGDQDPVTLRAIDRHAFWGWCVFSLSLIFGGAWGYVAWGAYFLWDPKVVWSVILWLFYSGFVHLGQWPAGSRPRVKAALGLVGFVVVLVAYIGTSWLFRHGSHSFG